eukprot:CAMPEP_0174385888 /NCGR_PEP_ID=MMETSP0811_2-20130205/126907_1 /TAXON_ID=73025 ORGANISM="Eutreptiella gymnastica-like, Strain CCMP1594" /NCGR_SAMPLE_ID=MMETSP0811_2 /ASSEMBLY_ACC=CAM_ASM_000667 /LENGTH=81 /DNA_ID=CAMNT_0015540367 /DNA_START=651 /DNA_END=896 /DNA_ORIENTATION=-
MTSKHETPPPPQHSRSAPNIAVGACTGGCTFGVGALSPESLTAQGIQTRVQDKCADNGRVPLHPDSRTMRRRQRTVHLPGL